ncbi:MAG: hypothetical protein Q4F41_11855 [Eubacteriales bacterium]|nr:hypothetical protein [Eubacteriales bacterium]
MSDKMSDKEKIFYRLFVQAFEENGFVTAKKMEEMTGMAESTIRRYLNKLRVMEVISSDGKNRGTKYYLK